jgi:hypothetical protein
MDVPTDDPTISFDTRLLIKVMQRDARHGMKDMMTCQITVRIRRRPIDHPYPGFDGVLTTSAFSWLIPQQDPLGCLDHVNLERMYLSS